MHDKGRNKRTVINIVFKKAYDRISWRFIEDTLRATGLSSQTVNLIMSCITSTIFQILWNGELTDLFAPKCGIRQG
ncbi:hypothetical protein LINPERPRIM_LOCUS29905, partial [Linum perenne]